MYKSLLLLSLLGVVCAQQNLDLDSLINKLFDVPPNATDASGIAVLKQDTIIQPVPQTQEPEDQPCTTSDVKDGQCVSYYLCDTNNTVIQDGVGMIDIRFQASPCPSYIDKCCNVPDAWEKDKSDKLIRKPNSGCGWRNPYGVGLKTTAGKEGESLFGEFPWMVAILRIENLNDTPSNQVNLFIGGGSLIHPAVVLTTAHHVDTINTLRVRAGEWDTQFSNEIYPHQDRDVDSVIVHEEFNTERNNLFYDIALLFLSSQMDTSVPNVGLACLPPPFQPTNGGELCVASGWGKDKFGEEGRYQVIMKKVTVPVVERKQCQTQLRKTHLGRFFELHSSFMCAGGEAGIDTCNEDGGSPLMCPIENESNRYMQSGIVAWGVGCGNEGVPGVYVDVSNLRDWIDDKITGKGFDPKKPNSGCGWRNPYGVGLKTTAGKEGESLFGEFPWMVAILRIENLNDTPSNQVNLFIGGGSLIHPAVVLTTAHHVDTINTLRVRAGEWDTQFSNEIYPHQDRDVDSVIVHEEFNTERNNLFYDIALLFLSSQMDTSVPNVGLACLPPPFQPTNGGELCVASGWGKDKFGEEGRYQVIMKKVTVPVVERKQCQTQLRKTHLGRFFELHSSFMCAGGEAGIDTCNEDGGSPLMCPIENESNRYMQSGIVAWGVGCGNEGVPGVYVDVSNLRDWIDDKITGKGFDPKVYTF